MSTKAAAYYEDMAERLDIDLPEPLNGKPISLLAPDEGRISLHSPNVDTVALATERYAKVLSTVAAFTVAAAKVHHPTYSVEYEERFAQNNRTHVQRIIDPLLFPAWLKAGRIQDVQVEAVSPDEVDKPLFNRATSNYRWLFDTPEFKSEPVCLVTSAELYSGRTLGRTACLTVAYAHIGANNLQPHYLATTFKKNDLLAASGLWQSRATATYIDHWGTANPFVQNVRRGTRQRGQN